MRQQDRRLGRLLLGAAVLAALLLCAVLLGYDGAERPLLEADSDVGAPRLPVPLEGTAVSAGPSAPLLRPQPPPAGAASPPVQATGRPQAPPTPRRRLLTVFVKAPDKGPLVGAVVRVASAPAQYEAAVHEVQHATGFEEVLVADRLGMARFRVPEGTPLYATLVLQDVVGAVSTPLVGAHRDLALAFVGADGSTRLRTHAVAPEVEVVGEEVTLELDEGLPVRLRLGGAAQGRRPRCAIRPGYATHTPDGDQPDVLWTSLLPGATASFQVEVLPGEGSGIPPQSSGWRTTISPAARALEAEVPIWPEASLRVAWRRMPNPADGTLLPRPLVVLEGLAVPGALLEDGPLGTFLVRGVAHPPGGMIQIGVLDRGTRLASVLGHLPLQAGEASTVTLLELDDDTPMPGPYAFDVPLDLPQPPLRSIEVDPTRTGTLEVHVQGARGPRGGDAVVTCGDRTLLTGPQGSVTFEDLPVGIYDIGVLDRRGGRRLVDVRVLPGETTTVRSRRGRPRDIALRVKDDEGAPVPYATVGVGLPSGLPWCDLYGGTQRIDPFTDHRGARILHGVEEGRVDLVARRGFQLGRDSLEARDVKLGITVRGTPARDDGR